MNKVLVLGGNGFIGSHLVDSLVERGYHVRVFDRFSQNAPTRFLRHDHIEIMSGDFMNRADISRALQGVSIVFHLISMTNPATTEDDPLIDIDTNLHGSVELFSQCAESRTVRRLIYLSSGGTVYGENVDGRPLSETDETIPKSPYGIAKLAAEHYLRYFRVKKGLNYTVFRLANPYGERQPLMNKQGVIPIFLDHIVHEEPVTVLGDGTMIRDYIYVKDAVEMMVETLAFEPKYEIYNIGSGVGTSINELIEALQAVTGKKVQRTTAIVPSTFVHSSVLDTTRYLDEFKLRPRTTAQEGIAMTYAYYKTLDAS